MNPAQELSASHFNYQIQRLQFLLPDGVVSARLKRLHFHNMQQTLHLSVFESRGYLMGNQRVSDDRVIIPNEPQLL